MRQPVTQARLRQFMREFAHSLIPGSELITKGLADIREGRVSEYSLLLFVARPRLERERSASN